MMAVKQLISFQFGESFKREQSRLTSKMSEVLLWPEDILLGGACHKRQRVRNEII